MSLGLSESGEGRVETDSLQYDEESIFAPPGPRGGMSRRPGAMFTARTRKRLIIAWAAMAIAALCVVYL
jgi:hypothetical protein